jgi:hypothetical protein
MQFTPSLNTATIGGTSVTILAGTLQISSIIGQRSTAEFTVLDSTNQFHFYQGMQTIIRDSAGNRLFTGYLASSKETYPANVGNVMLHDVTATNAHYLTDKRLAATSYTNQTAGYIVQDLVDNFLAGENVYYGTGKNICPDYLSTCLSATKPSEFTLLNSATMTLVPTVLWNAQDVFTLTTPGTHNYEGAYFTLPAARYTAGGTYTVSAYLRVASGTASNIRFNWCYNGSTSFQSSNVNLTTSWQRFSVTATLENPLTHTGYGLKIDTNNQNLAETIYIAGIQIEQAGSATAWEFGGTSIQNGPNIVAATINYTSVDSNIVNLASMASFIYYIDQWQRLWFVPLGTISAPFSINSHTHMAKDSVTVTNTSQLYRNRQLIVGGKGVTTPQTETRQGDGKTRAFTLSYPVNKKPSAISVNGTAKTIGIKGVDDQAHSKNFYWSKGDPVIAQETNDTILTSSDTLSVTYIGEYQLVVQLDDNAAQTERAGIEGSTTGIVEEAETILTVNSVEEGFQIAQGLLAKYVPQGQQVVFDTTYVGLAAGQQASITILEHSIINQSMLIEQVDTKDADPYVLSTVTAILGPYDTNWVSYFKKISRPPNVIDLFQSGESGTIALLGSYTATWPTVSASLTITITPCTWPSPTLYPSTSQYPS